MANHCHIYQHGNQGVLGLALSAFIIFLVGCSSCAAYTIRNHQNGRAKGHPLSDASAAADTEAADVDIDRFYFPTEEGLKEFQQILLRELGLTRVPDLSKVNITRDEYDRQRQQLMTAQDEEDDRVRVDEYREFSAAQGDEDEQQYKETVILNHGDVKATRRRTPGSASWRLRFRAPSSSNGSRWQLESTRPLELHLSASPSSRSAPKMSPFRGQRSWSLHVRMERADSPSFVVIRPEDVELSKDNSGRVKPDLGSMLDGWLNELSVDGGRDSQSLGISVACLGRDCKSLRHWRLSAQLRLAVWSSEDDDDNGSRVKRHVSKKNVTASSKKSNTSDKSNLQVAGKHRLANQPKDILLGQHHSSSKKGVGKSGGNDCSNSKKNKKCCPHSLKINFRQLPGFDWILEPSEIDIFMCKGDCHYAQFTMHGHHQHASNPASNHALFQGYLHTINKRLVPKLCCTPSKLDSIQVVHYDQDNPAQLTTTKWEGAIVRECACA